MYRRVEEITRALALQGDNAMKINEKQELVKLLSLYMDEIMQDYADNVKESAKYKKEERWKANYKCGLKAQYTHARIIQKAVAADVNREMKPYGLGIILD